MVWRACADGDVRRTPPARRPWSYSETNFDPVVKTAGLASIKIEGESGSQETPTEGEPTAGDRRKQKTKKEEIKMSDDRSAVKKAGDAAMEAIRDTTDVRVNLIRDTVDTAVTGLADAIDAGFDCIRPKN